MKSESNTDDWPTAGYSIDAHTQTEEFEDLKAAVEAYVETNLPSGEDYIERALAKILWEHRRDRFAESHGLAGVAETACIARLIDDDLDECPHSPGTHELNHSPPAADHPTLWLDDDGDPAMYSMHVYHGDLHDSMGDKPHSRWFDIIGWARDNRLDVGTRKSWYNPSTTQIVFEPMDDAIEYPPIPNESWSKQQWRGRVREAWDDATPPLDADPSLTTKTIDGQSYFYLQWRDDGVKTQYVAPEMPKDPPHTNY